MKHSKHISIHTSTNSKISTSKHQRTESHIFKSMHIEQLSTNQVSYHTVQGRSRSFETTPKPWRCLVGHWSIRVVIQAFSTCRHLIPDSYRHLILDSYRHIVLDSSYRHLSIILSIIYNQHLLL